MRAPKSGTESICWSGAVELRADRRGEIRAGFMLFLFVGWRCLLVTLTVSHALRVRVVSFLITSLPYSSTHEV